MTSHILLGLIFTMPDYQEKYQELLEREDLFPDYEENGTDLSGPGDQYVFFLSDSWGFLTLAIFTADLGIKS